MVVEHPERKDDDLKRFRAQIARLTTIFRPAAVWTVLIVWNVGLGIGIVFNGGSGEVTNRCALMIMGFVCCVGVLASLATLCSTSVQRMVLRPGVEFSAVRPYFWVVLLALLGLLGIALIRLQAGAPEDRNISTDESHATS